MIPRPKRVAFAPPLFIWAAVAPGEFGHRIAWLLKVYAI